MASRSGHSHRGAVSSGNLSEITVDCVRVATPLVVASRLHPRLTHRCAGVPRQLRESPELQECREVGDFRHAKGAIAVAHVQRDDQNAVTPAGPFKH